MTEEARDRISRMRKDPSATISSNERLNRREHRPRKLKTNSIAVRAGYSDELNRSDKIRRKREHLIDKLGHLRKWIEELEVLINDVIELIASDQLVLAAGVRVVGV